MSMIFISHAAADKPVVDDFFDLLQTGCDVRRKEIFCSSIDGAGIKTGKTFAKWIRNNLKECKLIILFLTPNYYASRFCVAEMGAAWVLKKDIFPLVIPNIERDAGAVLLGKQTAVIEESGLDHLRDHITEHYQDAGKSTARWSLKRDQFLEHFRRKLGKLPVPEFVDQSLLEEEKEKTAAAMEMNDELTEENQKLRKQIKRLEKAKDAKEVAKIKAEFTDADDHYSELVKQAIKLLDKLSSIESRCVFASIRNETWVPSEYDFREESKSIERAVQSDTIEEHGDEFEGICYEINSSHPRVWPALHAIKELDDFIEEKMSEDIRYKMVDNRGYYINVRNREYWDEELEQSSMPE